MVNLQLGKPENYTPIYERIIFGCKNISLKLIGQSKGQRVRNIKKGFDPLKVG